MKVTSNNNITTIEVEKQGLFLRRKSDGLMFGRKLTLGKTYQLGGVILDTPHQEIPADYEEVFSTSFDGQTLTLAYKPYDDFVDQLIRLKYSVSEELAVLRQRDVKPEEFEMYNTYCEKCKTFAKHTLRYFSDEFQQE